MSESQGDGRHDEQAPPAGAGAAVSLSPASLAAIFEHITDSIVVSDPAGIITQWNRGAERIFGYTAAEMVGRSVGVLSPDAGYDPRARLTEIASRGPLEPVTWQARHKDGRPIWIHVQTTAIRDAAGAVVGFVGVAKDITEHVNENALLRERLELERHLIGIVSHDLRNPLNAVVLSVALLERMPLPEKALRGIERIARATARSLKMIDNLVDFTRARRGDPMPLTPARGDLKNVVVSVTDELRTQFPGRSLVVDASSAVFDFDGGRLAQVVNNLVSNALQHTSVQHEVKVRLWVDGDDVRLDVWNSGQISDQVLPRLFSPYDQGHGNATDRSLGLGLFIARAAIEAHGGRVDVTSEPNRGTLFAVRLPRSPLAAPTGDVAHG